LIILQEIGRGSFGLLA